MRTCELQEIYQGLYDGPHATPKPSNEGPVFLGIKNITEDGRLDLTAVRHIAEDDFGNWTRRVTPMPGDIVFSYEATLHRYAVIPEGFRGCLGRRMALIRLDQSKVNSKFIFHYFFSDQWRDEVKKYILVGSTVDRIPLTKVPEFIITIPEKQKQDEIAGILSAYDSLIENNNRRIAILENMAQSLYREWFVNFRFPGHENCKFVDSPLGRVPEGWAYKKLKDVCRLTMGQSPKSEFYNEVGDGMPFHQGVTNFGTRFPADKLYCTADGRIAEEGDILFSVRAPVGRMNIANKKIVIGRGVSAIRHLDGCQAFLWEQLKSQFTKLDMMGNGAIFAAVTKDDMQGIDLLCPDNKILSIASEFLNPLHNEIFNLSKAVINLKEQRDMLLPRLVGGQVELGA